MSAGRNYLLVVIDEMEKTAKQQIAATVLAEDAALLLLRERDQLRIHVERLERICTQNRLSFPRWDQP